jgi:pimeloyl-ACP methyl ester carboxylesterase
MTTFVLVPGSGGASSDWQLLGPELRRLGHESIAVDLPAGDEAAGLEAGPAPEQAGKPFAEPWPLDAWPGVPTRVLAGRDDRLFPLGFQTRVARERLGITPEVVRGGHMCALSFPAELAANLHRGLELSPAA